MTEVVEQKGFGARRLVLGFDAGCMTCSELARKIEDEVGEKLEVRPLHDPQVAHWREQALGEDAPWAPTLVEVKGGEVKAWTGLKMGVVLGRRLGPGSTWRVMQLIGEIKAAPSATPNAGLSRRQFIKGLGGAAVGFGVLSASGGLASPALAAEERTSQVLASSGEDVAQILEEAEKAERAIALMEKHMNVAEDGTLVLDEKGLEQEVANGRAAGIDTSIFTELKRNLSKTNTQLLRPGKVKAENLLSTNSEVAERVDSQSRAQERFSTQRRCPGRTGVDYFWWGKRSYLNNCRTRRLVRRLQAGAAAGAIAALIPGFGTAGAVVATVQGIGATGIAGTNRGRGIYINYIARIVAVRVRAQ